jgi:hypothetical protein
MPTIKAVIFNHNQRETSEALLKGLSESFDTALFDSGSIESQVSSHSTHVFENLYWTGCWNKCWELFPDFDVIWGIGGDCTLRSAPRDYSRAIESLWPFGTWSPVVGGRAHEYMQPTKANRGIYSVTYLEGIGMAISRPLWSILGGFDRQNYIGHAQDLISCFVSRAHDLKNILDGRVELFHPASSQYDLEEARVLMFEALERRFGKNWSDVMDWWWGRRISFESNAVSVIELINGVKNYSCPFNSK